ncbi:hypothetical protein MC885_017367 [Smutsia gigantea]|nr:hypothetical protein MC885_017367 [Smutsia gigantea]
MFAVVAQSSDCPAERAPGEGARAAFARRASDALRQRPRFPPGYCTSDLPHSDSGSPPTQHRPCAKTAGQRPSIALVGA